MKIWLNETGAELFPWLANEWHTVYGYDPAYKSFIIWDGICAEWKLIPQRICEGRNEK